MLSRDNIDFLTSSLDFWSKLTDNERTLILNKTSIMIHDHGNIIYSGQNDCMGVLLVKSGTLRVYLLSEEGKEITLYRIYKGEVCILSASCLLKSITFDIHIDAECESETLLIDSTIFSQLVSENVYVENFSYKVALERFSDVVWTMEQILFMSFDKRLAIFLVDESSRMNSDTISLTHEQIAKYMGSAREVVSRMLKYFENEGIVKLSRGGIKIIDKSQLRSLI